LRVWRAVVFALEELGEEAREDEVIRLPLKRMMG
jgi:hypothetical protein